MIYTSYFANYRNFPDTFIPTCIALWVPKWIDVDTYKDLAPDKYLIGDWKNNRINKDEYTIRFFKQLRKLDVNKVARDLDGHILLCYEEIGDFCHRHLVATWLNDFGYEVKEL